MFELSPNERPVSLRGLRARATYNWRHHMHAHVTADHAFQRVSHLAGKRRRAMTRGVDTLHRSWMHVISREREANAGRPACKERAEDQGRGRGEDAGRGKGAKRAAKPAGAMTPHSVYGSDVDQLYATYARMPYASLRNARAYLPTVTEFHDRLIERFVERGSRRRDDTARQLARVSDCREERERERERERGGKMFVTYRPDLIEIWELETRLAALGFHVDGRNCSGGDSEG